jgi:protein-tyrosine phosphatase
MAEYGFGLAAKGEKLIFGSQRPGNPGKFVQRQVVDEWVAFMKGQGIQRVVCLLTEQELKYYPLDEGLLGLYATAFGPDNVLWAPTPDMQLPTAEALPHIMYFLYNSLERREKTVVHCAAGQGRTGLVLAAWLIFHERVSERKAIKMVEEQNRSLREAVHRGKVSEMDMMALLAVARELDKPA